jgi:hypothetical protein
MNFSDCKIVLVGSTHANRAVLQLSALPNVIMPGVVPYQELGAWIRRFDVAIVPHHNTKMTSSMNPLKIYAYIQWLKPIVATNVPNIDYSGDFIKIAETHDEFLREVEEVLKNPPASNEAVLNFLEKNNWSSRFSKHIDELFAKHDLA